MLLPRASLSSFLSSAKSALNGAIKTGEKVTFVVGNESADLDSICSAVLLAYLRTYSPRNHTKALYIPLSNLPGVDLGLRPELYPILEKAKVSIGDLLSLDGLRGGLKTENTRWILVDHNALQGDLGRVYGERVRGCIDHHDEENRVPTREICEEEGEMRIVEKSGSCASLVVERGRRDWKEMSRGDEEGHASTWDGELAYLALGPILIDTNNLQSKDKTQESDIEAVKFLESLIEKSPNTNELAPWDRDAYFSSISAAKEDIGAMNLRDILRKDYKEWSEGGLNLGISSIVRDLSFLLSKAGSKEKFLEILGGWGRERRLDICVVMTTSHVDGVFKRELLAWGLEVKGVQCLRRFRGEGVTKLGLRVWGEGGLDSDVDSDVDVDVDVNGDRKGEEKTEMRYCWWQDRIENSRKQVAPLLRQSMLRAQMK